jgi:histidinol-phosphate aminotransferase
MSDREMSDIRFRRCVTGRGGPLLYASNRKQNARIRLDLTTNPLGFPKRLLAFMHSHAALDFESYNGPPELPELKRALARRSGLRSEEIMITAGADQAIEIALTHLLDPGDKLGIHVPAFPRFEIVGRKICDADVRFFRSLHEIPEGCRAVCLCTPSNPTTKELDPAPLEVAVEDNPKTFFIIDAVFSDFGRNGVSQLVKKFGNVAVLKSFSKSFGLPGLRVGWLESGGGNIKVFREGASPFRVPGICQRLALEALKDRKHVAKTVEYLAAEFNKIKQELGAKAVRESDVPFFLFLTDQPEKAADTLLKRHGISVVCSSSFSGADRGFLRMAIGKKEENRALLEALKAL